MGWKIGEAPDGSACHSHGGSVRGFVSKIRRFPSIDGAIFILSNRDDTLPLTVIQNGVQRILFGKPADIAIPAAPSRKLLTRIAGEYVDNKNRKLVIAEGSGLPNLSINWGGPVTYGYLGIADDGMPHLFMLNTTDGNIDFRDDGELKFSPSSGRGKSVSLIDLTPAVVFKR